MPGIPFMRLIICAILLPVIICIILRVWSNCLMSLFTSWMLVPEPLAMRWRRDVLRMAGLVRSLGVILLDDGLYALECILWDIYVADSLAHARNHRCQILDVTHLLNLLDLVVEIVEVELVLSDLLLQFLSLFQVELLLCALYEDTTSPMPRIRSAIRAGMEHVNGVHLSRRYL